MGWFSDTFLGGAEKDAGDRAAGMALQNAVDLVDANNEAAGVFGPAIDEATRIKAEAAQRAVDLELAGFGQAEEIFKGIVNDTFELGGQMLTEAKDAIQRAGSEERSVLETTYSTASGLRDRASSKLSEGASRQRQALQEAYSTAREDYKASIASARQEIGTGFDQALSMLDEQYASAEDGFRKAIEDGRELVQQQQQKGIDALSGFEGGREAFRMQLAMTGALGPEAQQQFYDSYQQSPATKYKLEQAQRLIGSGASGGSRLRRLQELGIGIVSQELDTYFQQLGQQSERAQRQGENIADLTVQYGDIFGGLAESEAAGIANLRKGLGDAKASNRTEKAKSLAGLDERSGAFLSSLSADYGQSIGDSFAREGEGLADIDMKFMDTATGLGTDYANSYLNQGEKIAGLKSDAIPILTDFQKFNANNQALFAGGKYDIMADLERELAGLSSDRVLAQGELVGNTKKENAQILASGRGMAVDAENAGNIAGSGVMRSTINDIASGIGSAGGLKNVPSHIWSGGS